MKREVIFRGWSPIQGKWIYGSGVHETPFRSYLLTDGGQIREVEQETVGEWTGLKDDDGTEIYEGDVVSVVPILGVKYRGIIIFNPHIASFEVHREEREDMIPLRDDFSIVVIGNIFDDPDLKKKYGEIYQK